MPEIPLNSFEKGNSIAPIRGSTLWSFGLESFFYGDGQLRAGMAMVEKANSTDLTDLAAAVNFLEISSVLYVINPTARKIFSGSIGTDTFSLKHTLTSGTNNYSVVAPDPTDTTKLNIYIFKAGTDGISRAVPPYSSGGGDWTNAWKSSADFGSFQTGDHHAVVVRDWVLFCNGQYIGGWKFSTGAAESVSGNVLDLQPGYTSKFIHVRKSNGSRLVYIHMQHNTDRRLDGIGIWNIGDPTLLDFIKIPVLQSVIVDEQSRVWCIKGIQGEICQVTSSGAGKPINRITPWIVVSNTVANRFHAIYKGMIILSAAQPQSYEYPSFSGLFLFNPNTGALAPWLHPKRGDIYQVTSTAVHVSANDDVYVSFGVGSRYSIEKMEMPGSSNAGTDGALQHAFLPVIGDDNPDTKVWNSFKFSHRFLDDSQQRIEVRVRDWTRDFLQVAAAAVSSATSTSVTKGNSQWGTTKVGDAVIIIGGAGAGQIRTITDVTNATLTIDRAWTTNPDSGSTLVVWSMVDVTGAATTKDTSTPFRRTLSLNQQSVKLSLLISMRNEAVNTTSAQDVAIRGMTINYNILEK